jgi:hypothetical protein
MALCPQHTFQVLTKRAERMRAYFKRMAVEACGEDGAWAPRRLDAHACDLSGSPCAAGHMEDVPWPLSNVWLGVSAERQQEADERIPHLLATPAAIRFVSCEPLLGPIDLMMLVQGERAYDALQGAWAWKDGDSWEHGGTCAKLDLVIDGGESGRRARGALRSLFRSLRDQCAMNGTAYFHKQNGEWIDADEWLDMIQAGPSRLIENEEREWRPARPLNYSDAHRLAVLTGDRPHEHQSDGTTLIRVGKKAAGNFLDRVQHLPEVRT